MREIIKKRSFKFSGISTLPSHSKLHHSLLKMEGVKKVEVDDSGQVFIEYDLLRTRLEMIEESIESIGFKLQSGGFTNIKRALIYYTEQNEYDNLTAPNRPCCSDPKL